MLDHLLWHVLIQRDRRIEGESSARVAVCGHCKKRERLLTCVVQKRLKLLFVPIVRLGREVLVDHCQKCNKAALELDVAVWERMSSAARAVAAESGHLARGTPEAWLEPHAAALVFAREAEADDVAYRLAIDPRSTARVHAHLAWAHRWKGRVGAEREAGELARSLDPRSTAALDVEAAIERGELDSALSALHARRAQLGELHQGSVRALVRALAKAKRWRDLHALLHALFAEFPHFAYDREARRAARLVARRLDAASPLRLPRLRGENKVRNRAIAAVAAAVLVCLGVEAFARANRPVFLVNASSVATYFTVDGGARELVAGIGWQRRDLGYGRHTFEIAGPAARTFDVDVPRAGLLACFDRGVVVVDLGGDALLRHEVLRPGSSKLEQLELLFGRDVHAFSDLTRAFGTTLGGVGRSSTDAEHGERLVLVSKPAVHVALDEVRAGRVASAGALLEDRLRRRPNETELLQPYAWVAHRLGWYERAHAVLEPRVAIDPPVIDAQFAAWMLFRDQADADLLAARYEKRLATSAATAALATCRAHLSIERDEARAWIARALARDASDMLTLRHAADLEGGIDWNACLARVRAGLAKDPHDAFLLDMRNGAMLALGRAEELEAELREELARPRRDMRGHEERQGRLAELLVARGRSTELDLFVREQERGAKGADSARRSERLRALAMEAGGRVEELSKSRFRPEDAQLARWQIVGLAELGRAREIDLRLARETRIVDMWYDAAVIAVALDLAGDAKSASRWRELALERLMPWGAEAKAAAIVRGEHAASVHEIEALALGAHETSVLLVAAAHAARGRAVPIDAARVAELLDAAARFHPWPGHVQRLVARLRAAS